jgi:hypothetical protein
VRGIRRVNWRRSRLQASLVRPRVSGQEPSKRKPLRLGEYGLDGNENKGRGCGGHLGTSRIG